MELAGGNQRGVVGAGTTTVITSPEAVAELADLATNDVAWLYLAVLVVGVGLFALRRESNHRLFWLALAWAIGAPALSFLLNFVIAIYTPRYVVYMVIGLAIAVAAVIASQPTRLRYPLLAVTLAVTLWGLPGQRDDLMANRIPVRDLYRRASESVQPGDVIFFDQRNVDDNFFRWMIRTYLSRTFTRVESVAEAATHDRVWFVTDNLNNAQVQERFRQIEQNHPLQQVIGKCDSDWCYVIQLLATSDAG
jgi:hypothetical protein